MLNKTPPLGILTVPAHPPQWGYIKNKSGSLYNDKSFRDNQELEQGWTRRIRSYTRLFLQKWGRCLLCLIHRNCRFKQNEETEIYFKQKKLKPQKNSLVIDIKTSNLSDKVFKVMIIKMLMKLRRRMDEHWGHQQREN